MKDWRQALLMALVLGLVCAAVVWWLERFEVSRVIGEAEGVLRKHAAFEEWLNDRNGSS